jgi:hypothetical protein
MSDFKKLLGEFEKACRWAGASNSVCVSDPRAASDQAKVKELREELLAACVPARRPGDSFIDGDSELVFWAFRYFLGRATAATGLFAQHLGKAWPTIAPNYREGIKKELEQAIADDNRARDKGFEHKPLGHDCDRDLWLELMNVIKVWEQADEHHP